jgi:hypothetical protein
LGTLYRCVADRIEALNAGKLTAIRGGNNETALALKLQADRIGALAKSSRPLYANDRSSSRRTTWTKPAKSLEPLRRRVARSTNSTHALELDAVREMLIANIASIDAEEY